MEKDTKKLKIEELEKRAAPMSLQYETPGSEEGTAPEHNYDEAPNTGSGPGGGTGGDDSGTPGRDA